MREALRTLLDKADGWEEAGEALETFVSHLEDSTDDIQECLEAALAEIGLCL